MMQMCSAGEVLVLSSSSNDDSDSEESESVSSEESRDPAWITLEEIISRKIANQQAGPLEFSVVVPYVLQL